VGRPDPQDSLVQHVCSAVIRLGRTGRRREITVSGMKIRCSMTVDLHGSGEEAVVKEDKAVAMYRKTKLVSGYVSRA
jgi:hypothetical protein